MSLDGKLFDRLAEFLEHAIERLDHYDLREVHAEALKELQPAVAKAKRVQPIALWLKQLKEHVGQLTQLPQQLC